jgi:Zn-dependent protease with chaperone function
MPWYFIAGPTIVVLAHLGLAALPALVKKSWLRFFVALPLLIAGITLPLFFFFSSALLVPDWKGNCQFGWLDCFYAGKTALTPLVLYATLAFYASEVWRVADRTRPWIVHGMFLGAVITTVCLLYGFLTAGLEAFVLLLVPLFITAWYVLRTVQLMRQARLPARAYLLSLVITIPFWLAAEAWSIWYYLMLPNTPPPEC